MTTLEVYEKTAGETFGAQSGDSGIGDWSCLYRTRQKVGGFEESYLTAI